MTVLVEVTRGLAVESRHSGAVAVADTDGRLALAIGNVEAAIFPRSAVKALQALPLIESGAAERFGYSDAELALACASHSGEPEHVATAAGALARLGLGAETLECGAHWPIHAASARALAASGQGPTALHNNCSGKHAGFLCVACAMEVEPAGYVAPDHPVQRETTAALEAMIGASLTDAPMGIDGCGIPAFAMPLTSLARAFARFGAGHGLPEHRAGAARRLCEAVWAAPFQVAGSGRFDTEAMQLLGRTAFVKGGAEGVHVAALPELGLGVAVKIDDGAGRAAETTMAALLMRFLRPDGEAAEWLERRCASPVFNRAGAAVGAVRPGAALSA